MNKIHQIQFQFLPIEDRLLMKMNTTNKEEFSFFLTRRFVSLLYPILTKILHDNKSVNTHEDKALDTSKHRNDQIHKEIVKLQQQETVANTDTNSPYQKNELTHPLGNQPILLSNISTNASAEELKLSLTPKNGQGISFSIDQNVTHLLRNLLLESLEKTDWQLEFQADYISPAVSTPADKKFLH